MNQVQPKVKNIGNPLTSIDATEVIKKIVSLQGVHELRHEFIRHCRNPNFIELALLSEIIKNPWGQLDYDTAKKAVAAACESGNFSVVKTILQPGLAAYWDRHITQKGLLNAALYAAMYEKHTEITDYLLTSPDLQRNASVADKDYRILCLLTQHKDIAGLNKMLSLLSESEQRSKEVWSQISFGLKQVILTTNPNHDWYLKKLATKFMGSNPPAPESMTAACLTTFSYLVKHPAFSAHFDKAQVQEFFLTACRTGVVEVMDYFLNSPDLSSHAQADTFIQKGYWHEENLNHPGATLVFFWEKEEKKNKSEKEKIHEAFLNVCESGSIEAYDYLTKTQNIQPHSYGLIITANSGHLALMTHMCSEDREHKLNAQVLNNKALYEAADKGRAEIINYLLSSKDLIPEHRADPRAHNNNLFKKACRYDNLELVKHLVSHHHIMPETKNVRNLFFWLGYPKNSLNQFFKEKNFSIKEEVLGFIKEFETVNAERDYLTAQLQPPPSGRQEEIIEVIDNLENTPKKSKTHKI